MTLDRNKRDIVFHCDGPKCHETLETGETDFNDAIAAFKAEYPRWRMLKEGTEWNHYCEDCYG